MFKVDSFSVEFVVRANEISVVRVWPLYGPVAGGTRVTITGQFVNVQIVTAVYFNEHKIYPDTDRLFCPQVVLSIISFNNITYESFIILTNVDIELCTPLIYS